MHGIIISSGERCEEAHGLIISSAERCIFTLILLEFEFHLDIQVDSSNNVCSKWRMKIQTEQNKPHRKHTSIA